jgi:hypothetical protein
MSVVTDRVPQPTDGDEPASTSLGHAFITQYQGLRGNAFSSLFNIKGPFYQGFAPRIDTGLWLAGKSPGVQFLPGLDIGKTIAAMIVPPIDPVAAYFSQRSHFGSLLAPFSGVRIDIDRLFPSNWKDLERPPRLREIEPLILDEGIPLAWVPDAVTLQAIFDAPNRAARRQILSRRWKHTKATCDEVLAEIDHPSLTQHLPFATAVAQALGDGHTSAAQALATNLLDTILRRDWADETFKAVTRKKSGPIFDMEQCRVREAITLAPIWCAYAQYWQDKGDPIPRTFGRHPSAHAVSRTQYSRINAVTALMLVIVAEISRCRASSVVHLGKSFVLNPVDSIGVRRGTPSMSWPRV